MSSTHRDASRELARRDRVISLLFDRHGPMRIAPAPKISSRFESLCNAIVSQQLHGRAAASIWSRVVNVVGEPFTAEGLLATEIDDLRAAGLSGSKVRSLHDLAESVEDGRVRLERLGRWSDAEVIDHLTSVRGIGPWTAQMFLIFSLHRLDVWPTGDYGVRTGYGRLFTGGVTPTARELEAMGERFAPYRSVAAWYCWAAADDPGLAEILRQMETGVPSRGKWQATK